MRRGEYETEYNDSTDKPYGDKDRAGESGGFSHLVPHRKCLVALGR
jgi:hypothetical protein